MPHEWVNMTCIGDIVETEYNTHSERYRWREMRLKLYHARFGDDFYEVVDERPWRGIHELPDNMTPTWMKRNKRK